MTVDRTGETPQFLCLDSVKIVAKTTRVCLAFAPPFSRINFRIITRINILCMGLPAFIPWELEMNELEAVMEQLRCAGSQLLCGQVLGALGAIDPAHFPGQAQRKKTKAVCILTSMEALDREDRVSSRFMKCRSLAKGLDCNLARFWLSGTILPKTCAH